MTETCSHTAVRGSRVVAASSACIHLYISGLGVRVSWAKCTYLAECHSVGIGFGIVERRAADVRVYGDVVRQHREIGVGV